MASGLVATIGSHSTPIEAAIATLITSAAVALTDYAARKRQENRERAHKERHEQLFLGEHKKTRRAISEARKRRQRKGVK